MIIRDTPSEWRFGWPLSIICRIKEHKPGRWRTTYQPHVEQQDCQRCGAKRYRTLPFDPARLP